MLNATPHEINVFRPEDVSFRAEIRKHVATAGTAPAVTIPASGLVLGARFQTTHTGALYGVPIFDKRLLSVDPIPPGDEAVVVSALYAAAAEAAGADTSRLFLVSDPVYSEDGRTVLGCLGLVRAGLRVGA